MIATSFAKEVYRIVAQVPSGQVTTYGDVARALGKPGAARVVGSALACNPDTIAVPCHRVVRTSGHVGGYQGHLQDPGGKRLRLGQEGVVVDDRGFVVQFASRRCRCLKGSAGHTKR